MSGKLIDYLIDDIRESTDNEDYSSTTGMSEEEIIKFINQAQFRLHSKICSVHPQVFTEEDEQDVVVNTETYDLDHKAFLQNKVVSVEYSDTGDTDDYAQLGRISPHLRRPASSGTPSNYFIRSNKVYLSPIPDTSRGSIRIIYTRKIKSLDKRRASVEAVTTNGSRQITNLEVNYVNGTDVDNTALLRNTRFCVVDQYGALKMENVLLSEISTSVSYDATLEVDSSFTYLTTESIAVGDYIVPGDYSTTHCEFVGEVERYIQTFAEWKALKRSSSVDSGEAIEELQALEDDIVKSYAEVSDDINYIPDINGDNWE